MGLYADKLEKAVALAINQRNDGWDLDSILRYWVMLEGEQFAEEVVSHL